MYYNASGKGYESLQPGLLSAVQYYKLPGKTDLLFDILWKIHHYFFLLISVDKTHAQSQSIHICCQSLDVVLFPQYLLAAIIHICKLPGRPVVGPCWLRAEASRIQMFPGIVTPVWLDQAPPGRLPCSGNQVNMCFL